MGTKDRIAGKILAELLSTISTKFVDEAHNRIKDMNNAIIDIGEWDSAYNNINKMLYKLDSDRYIDNRTPTTHKDFYELSLGISYTINLPNHNRIKVFTYLSENKVEIRLKIRFIGNNKYHYRRKFLINALKLTDKNHIKVHYLSENELIVLQQPHLFDNIILPDGIKGRIVNGLTSWKNSKEWYAEHQLVHKIGVLLYGQPGTGKSTVARAISTMFNNAPILVLDPDNIMKSIAGIVRMRNRYVGTLIVLIEDFDMYFKSRDEVLGKELNADERKKKDNDQNAVFQLLDGVYSTENTIYIASTNHIDRIDTALIRYGRFDIQEELSYFDKETAVECVKMLGYDEAVLNDPSIEYPAQPSYIQSKVMEYRANGCQVIPSLKQQYSLCAIILTITSTGIVCESGNSETAVSYDLNKPDKLAEFISLARSLGIDVPLDWNLAQGTPKNAKEIGKGLYAINQTEPAGSLT